MVIDLEELKIKNIISKSVYNLALEALKIEFTDDLTSTENVLKLLDIPKFRKHARYFLKVTNEEYTESLELYKQFVSKYEDMIIENGYDKFTYLDLKNKHDIILINDYCARCQVKDMSKNDRLLKQLAINHHKISVGKLENYGKEIRTTRDRIITSPGKVAEDKEATKDLEKINWKAIYIALCIES